MSTLSKQKNSKWNLMMEQRRRGLSKLKGLVIPETSENDVQPAINIPEIKSQPATFVQVPKLDNINNNTQIFTTNHDSLKSSIVIPPWPTNTTSNIPKYSPAFKRKSLQVYPTNVERTDSCEYVANAEVIKYCDKSSSKLNKLDDDINPPKSLESISSPTRSDCSFDYVSSTKRYIREPIDSFQKSHVGKVEDESDNDSAVSSSQSSYNSRFSPPPSPTRSYDLNSYKNKSEDELNSQNRLLKPSSVEAINRKNILASAKCRSGKDLKIGSPVIRRKQEEQASEKKEEPAPTVKAESSPGARHDAKISEKLGSASISTSNDRKDIVKHPANHADVEKSIPAVKIAPKNTFAPISKPPAIPPLKNGTEDMKENKITRELYSSRSILSGRTKPINVKALREKL
ncbi:hypothetical protein NQ318_014540 [Aromia moschata]|uniref:Uncharacterized protein n=1 Tax=Aromia moschata TaxID=1265417 RepID=A0AAV8XHX1_9CUCU|nr:hypothetical protein NQ318_014540 [Aromia moschata]